MLVAALTEHEGALRAALAAEYPSLPPLRDILAGGTGVHMLDLADLVEHLPDGCALWRAAGGWRAWSADMQMLAVIEYRTQGISYQLAKGKGHEPKPIDPPPLASEDRVKQARMDSKRQRFIERRRQRQQPEEA